MSHSISFRPTPAAEAALAVLMERWRCRRSQAINIALEDAAGQAPKEEPPREQRQEKAVSRETPEGPPRGQEKLSIKDQIARSQALQEKRDAFSRVKK